MACVFQNLKRFLGDLETDQPAYYQVADAGQEHGQARKDDSDIGLHVSAGEYPRCTDMHLILPLLAQQA